jgi:hypothetical protein
MHEEKVSHVGFLRCPNLILYGLPDVQPSDKWLLLSLMGLCWNRQKIGKSLKELEGPYQFSLRQIAAIGGVAHATLRSKEGKNPREGSLDRLQALGYITIFDACPINEMTKSVGRKQTYLYIHLQKIWDDNAAFMEKWNIPSSKLVREDSFITDYVLPVREREPEPQEAVTQPAKTKQERIQELQSMPYAGYLKTPEWQEKRKKALRFASFKCQLCNSGERLNVHHRTYERLGQELMGDLITLCNDCHSTFHQNRDLAD